MNGKRLRPIGYIVQPQFVVDDGEELTTIQVQPLSIPVQDWPNVVGLVEEATDQLRQQVEGPELSTVRKPRKA